MTATQKPTIAAPEAGAVQVEQARALWADTVQPLGYPINAKTIRSGVLDPFQRATVGIIADLLTRLAAQAQPTPTEETSRLNKALEAGRRIVHGQGTGTYEEATDAIHLLLAVAGGWASQAQPTPRGESGAREAVARIVAPRVWAEMDAGQKSGTWWPQRDESLKIADAILALPELSTPIPTGEGLREERARITAPQVREVIRLAYKTGYNEGYTDATDDGTGNGYTDRDACEEGWQQYADTIGLDTTAAFEDFDARNALAMGDGS